MILVDTSVWIDYFNDIENEEVAILRGELDRGTVAMGDLILLEILQGAGSPSHARRLERTLRLLPSWPLLSPVLAVRAATHYRALRVLGISLRRTTDLIIGTFCIETGTTLLHRDRDFAPMARHLGLRAIAPSLH
jgi:predicted nucleic acid-binding protein